MLKEKSSRSQLRWAVFFSVSFMFLLLYMADWSHFSSIVDRATVKDLVVAFTFLLTANIVRAYRFYTLDHLGNSIAPWLVINKVYNVLTATLPGGIGEAATAYVLNRFSQFNILGSFRILLLSRVMDLAGLSILLLVTASSIGSESSYRGILFWAAAALLAISIIAMIPSSERFILSMLQRVPGRNKLLQLIRQKIDSLSEIMRQSHKKKTFGITLIQSIFVISLTAVSLHFIGHSFKSGFSLLQSIYCYAIYALLQMIPVQGIAGIGTQPARWAVALNLAGYAGPDAIAMGIVFHGTFYVFILLMGLGAVTLWLISRKTENIV
jgi:hypothetical protein